MMPQRRMTLRAKGLATWLLGLSCLVGCIGTPPLWAEMNFNGLAYDNLWVAVIDLLDTEGFHVQAGDPGSGAIESEWLYGTSVREVRGPSRRKAMIEISQSLVTPGWVVRLRVREEVIRKGGLRATQVRDSADWEEWHDNWDETEFLAAKIRARLSDYFVDVKVKVERSQQG
ncbi:MAG: hypothetical protein ACI9EF_001284 [Pseudohongiellaceae bacterium]|jgi:hypothetical protein